MTRLVLTIAVLSLASAQQELPPNRSVRFAVIGDAGTGDSEQYEVADQMARVHAKMPFDFVIMMGDNLYGSEDPEDYREKFELPYRALLDRGVKFYASLGNHDNPIQRFYAKFNMEGKRYYSFSPAPGVRFFALDSTYPGADQLEWIRKSLAESNDEWKIAFFHHPLYSSGKRHGPDDELRRVLEPIFIEHGIDAVFTGHEHFYERIKPQHGIYHFIMGSSGKLRKGNLKRTALTARGFDRERAFMVVELTADELCFQTITRTGDIVDSGALPDLSTAEAVASGP